MKKIHIKFLEFSDTDHITPGTYAYFLYSILTKYFEVEISNTPDYVFFLESSDEHLKYSCVKIFCTGENVSPNFNFCDYAIGFDWMDFGDRYYRFPIYLNSVFYRKDELKQADGVDWTSLPPLSKEGLASKTEFCSFVYSNYRGEKTRRELFDVLSTYKTVNAGGVFLNNTGGPVANKLDFESKHKFSIACENSSRSGYTTEKIIGSFMANTIPIYWGDPDVVKQFNPKRFINCHEYRNFDEVLNRVKEIDADDSLFLSIINEPISIPEYNFSEVRSGLEIFLKNIFDQPILQAKRASINPNRLDEMKKREKIAGYYTKIYRFLISISVFFYKPFKQFSVFEKIKHSILSK